MNLERICHEESDSCYLCGNNVQEGNEIICPKDTTILLDIPNDEEKRIEEYLKAVKIAKACKNFKKITIFDK